MHCQKSSACHRAASSSRYDSVPPWRALPCCGQHCVLELLAWWTGEAGDAAAAEHQYAALLPVDGRVLGPEHPAALGGRNDLARWTEEAGDPAAVRDHYAELLPLRERVLGPEHPATLADPARARPLDRQGGRCPSTA